MKLFTFVIYFACFCIINAKITHEKGREILVKSLTECKTKENGSEDELKRLLAMQYPETLEGIIKTDKSLVVILHNFIFIGRSLYDCLQS